MACTWMKTAAGQVLFNLVGFDTDDFARDTFYPALGFLVGKIARDRVVVIDGLTFEPSSDQLKALGAAAASSGAVALFHIVGITPEAPTLAAAIQGRSTGGGCAGDANRAVPGKKGAFYNQWG